MTSLTVVRVSAVFAALLAGAISAFAQDAAQPSPGFLDGLFGERSASPAGRDRAGQDRVAQSSGAELVIRLDRLEAQIRQLTGTLEQLQFRNQQLEGQLRRLQEDTEYRLQDLKGGAPATGTARPPGAAPSARPPLASPPAASPTGTPGAVSPARRGDAFDPTLNPTAPGAPRALGSVMPGGPVPAPVPDIRSDDAAVGVPGGRAAGAPLDLSTLAPPAAIPPAGEAARNPNASGPQLATAAPSDTPKDNFDLAYGYILRRDYALAEESLRVFLRKYPSDRLAPDAQYWLGESLFQRQRYRDAAEAFLNVSTKYETTAKAPDALLRLGQALAALGEKEAACASLGEALRKYPRASAGVKQGVEREQKRVHC
jgi:tol-pal system protein YbgF